MFEPGLGFSTVEVHAGAVIFGCGSGLNFPTSSEHHLEHELWFKFCLSYEERETGLDESFGEAQLGDTGLLNSMQHESLRGGERWGPQPVPRQGQQQQAGLGAPLRIFQSLVSQLSVLSETFFRH